jgi:predicted O-linked N-acetylglucosamine transferase (SPINDLY family)
MARRPCAIQATWLGYPGTTGADFIDYLIADPVVVPQAAEIHYSERIARLPRCYQPNDRARAVAEPCSREDYGLPAQGFVFCCFNQTYKITPDVFAVWMRLLTQVPGSVLWLLDSHPLAKRNLLQSARHHGVDAQRLRFAPRLPNAQHLARYRVADLALDTFPYTSHTTMSDALWCGCAAVALCGDTFASRVSASVLTAADTPVLVTQTLDGYARLALRLAGQPDELREVRARIARSRDRSALFDSQRFTRDLETLYADLLRRQHRA